MNDINPNKKLKSINNEGKDSFIFSCGFFFVFLIILVFTYVNRYIILNCHDSLNTVVDSVVESPKQIFYEISIWLMTRGRLSILFPFILTLRDLLYKTQSYWVFWAAQRIPLYLSVFLIARLLAKRFNKYIGLAYAGIFFVFLTINNGHSLIICYPFEFLYGVTLMAFSIYCYLRFLENNYSKKMMLLSAFLYYESMQVYESFIVACMPFFIIALYKTINEYKLRKEKGINFKPVKYIFAILMPQIITVTIFVAILIYLRMNPVSEQEVIDMGKGITFKGFLLTWSSFTFSMFPLAQFIILRGHVNLSMFLQRRTIFIATISGIFGLLLAIGFLRQAKTWNKETISNVRKKLIKLMLIGSSIGLFFALPHALTGTYQDWVINGGARAYVPTTICYFAWVTATLSFALLIVLHFIDTKIKRAIITMIVTVFFIIGGALTEVGNIPFRRENRITPVKSQIFLQLLKSEEFKDMPCDVLYCPEYMGIHYKCSTNEELIKYDTGKDTKMIIKEEDIKQQLSNRKEVCELLYDVDAFAGVLLDIDEGTTAELMSDNTAIELYADSAYFITPHRGSYEVSYVNIKGEKKNVEITAKTGQTIKLDVNENEQVLASSFEINKK